jgi:hypothetical protein
LTDSLFIAVMTGCNRSAQIQAQWETGLMSIFISFRIVDIRYFGYTPLNSDITWIRDRYVDVPPTDAESSRHHLCEKLHVAVTLFLATDASWLLRLCDDSFINNATFPLFLRDLRMIGDPTKVRIIQGHLITKPWLGSGYPQGGSGIVFSRAIAEHFLSSWEKFAVHCHRSSNDDHAVGAWAIGNGISAANMTSRWFLGHSFAGPENWERIPSFVRRRRVPKCPEFPSRTNGARPYFQRVKDVTFWHVREESLKFHREAAGFIRALPDNLWFHTKWHTPLLCWASRRSRLKFYE